MTETQQPVPAPARTAQPRRTAEPSSAAAVRAMASAELRLLLRRTGSVLFALLLPLALVGFTFVGERPDTPGRWAATLAMHTVIALLMTAYMNTAILLTVRRETLVFKRLRTTELSGGGLLLATLLPVAVLSTAQLAILLGVNVATGAPWPRNPALVAAGLASGMLLAFAAAAAVSALTGATERVQYTTMPLLIGAAVGSEIVAGGYSDVVSWAVLAIPLVAAGDMVNKGWAGSEAGAPELPDAVLVPAAAQSAVITAVWLAVAVAVCVARWRWEPRG